MKSVIDELEKNVTVVIYNNFGEKSILYGFLEDTIDIE